MIDDWDITHHRLDMPEEIWQYLKDKGFFGLCMSKEYGGLGFSALAHSTIICKVASASVSVGVSAMVPNSLGPAELIYHYGTDEQKQHYLPRLASGQEIPCFALTSPFAGSDAGAIPDRGVVCRGEHNGKEMIGIRLSWDKHYITLAPVATVLGLAFKLYDPEHLLGDKEDIGITVCLMPTDHPGVKTGKRHFPLNMSFMNGPTTGKDVFIPMDWIIGGPDMVGQGWRMLMECLSIGRSISLPSISTAVGQYSYAMTGAYARIRKQFKLPIGKFEGVQEPLARIAGFTYMLEASRQLTAWAVDLGVKPSVVSAIAKYHMTEISRQVVNDSMDICGGRGIQLGPRNFLGRGYQALPISITVEGANILTRNLIIFGQGAMRCHPYVRREIDAVNHSDERQGFKLFDKAICEHMGYTISQVARSLFYGLGGWRLIRTPSRSFLKPYYQKMTRFSCHLSMMSDFAMLSLGSDLKRKERLSARLGDVMSQLYLASAIIKFYEDQGARAEDEPFVHWGLQECLHRAQQAFDSLLSNFPSRGFAGLMRLLSFPFGRAVKCRPSDDLDHILAENMLHQNNMRDRMSQFAFVDTDPATATGRIEQTFKKVLAAAEIEKKLQQAIRQNRIAADVDFSLQVDAAASSGVLTSEEAKILLDAQAAMEDAVRVDEFTEEQLKGTLSSCQTETKVA